MPALAGIPERTHELVITQISHGTDSGARTAYLIGEDREVHAPGLRNRRAITRAVLISFAVLVTPAIVLLVTSITGVLTAPRNPVATLGFLP